jgi:hypothetical protein
VVSLIVIVCIVFIFFHREGETVITINEKKRVYEESQFIRELQASIDGLKV